MDAPGHAATGDDRRGAEQADGLQRRAALATWLAAVFAGAEAGDPVPPPPSPSSSRLRSAMKTVERLNACVSPRARCVREAERVRLFVNALGGVAAPPYGSWWTEGTLMGRGSGEVAGAYRAEGLDAAGAGPPDWLPTELEFVAFLLLHQRAAALTRSPQLERRSRRREARFLERHMQTWIGPFCSATREAAGDDYWPGLADLAEAFVADEAARCARAAAG